MEETIRALQANDVRPDARYGDCSLFPGMRLPPKFKDSLSGSALDWFMSLKAEDILTWEDLSRKFTDQYRYCAETPPTLLELSTKEMARGQKFEEYAAKWRAQAAKHIPPISEAQQIQLFHSTLRGVYYSHLLAHTSSFSDLIEPHRSRRRRPHGHTTTLRLPPLNPLNPGPRTPPPAQQNPASQGQQAGGAPSRPRGTLDGPSSDSDDTSATPSAVYAVIEEIPSGVHIRLAQENEELDNWTSVPRYSAVIADV
ncbi:hypothetical protein CRG98_035784 [Punica granatum]|uniref:Retrotransposon gag domain-containing protein n=1 Tax=Punica granatum TaxID=22663 RepID=A0A2I0IIK9_PUNGR|nr:hypothetical protein CRG98_035784 [Punica granatum]